MKRTVFSIFALTLLSSASAHALPFTWNTYDPDFYAVRGGKSVTESNTDSTARLNWGIPATKNKQSGYIFEGTSGNIDVQPGETETFDIGVFTHENFEIVGNSGITGTKLQFTLDILGETFNPIFDISHNETTNTKKGCCNDIVSTSNSYLYEKVLDNMQYSVYLTAFNLSTKEEKSNKFAWSGKVSVAEIPIPAGFVLFGTGLAGVAFMNRSRKRIA